MKRYLIVDMKNQETLGQRLKRIRNCNDFTQQQVADILNIDRSTYSYYETGKTEPNHETTIKLAKIFNVSIEELLTGEKRKETGASDTGYFPGSREFFNNLSKDEKFFLINYRLLNKEDKKELTDMLMEKRQKDEK